MQALGRDYNLLKIGQKPRKCPKKTKKKINNFGILTPDFIYFKHNRPFLIVLLKGICTPY